MVKRTAIYIYIDEAHKEEVYKSFSEFMLSKSMDLKLVDFKYGDDDLIIKLSKIPHNSELYIYDMSLIGKSLGSVVSSLLGLYERNVKMYFVVQKITINPQTSSDRGKGQLLSTLDSIQRQVGDIRKKSATKQLGRKKGNYKSKFLELKPQIDALLAEGKKQKEIAQILNVNENSLNTFITRQRNRN